jgi:hypothetical protein
MACSSLRFSLKLRLPAIGSVADCVSDSSNDLQDHDLIGKERMAIGEIEHRLLRQLLRMIGARPPLEDDFFIRVNNVEVANPATGGAVYVTLNELGEFHMVLAQSEPN